MATKIVRGKAKAPGGGLMRAAARKSRRRPARQSKNKPARQSATPAAAVFEVTAPEWERARIPSLGARMREDRAQLEGRIGAFIAERTGVQWGKYWVDQCERLYPGPLGQQLAAWIARWMKIRAALDRHLDRLTNELGPAAAHYREHHVPDQTLRGQDWLRKHLGRVCRRAARRAGAGA